MFRLSSIFSSLLLSAMVAAAFAGCAPKTGELVEFQEVRSEKSDTLQTGEPMDASADVCWPVSGDGAVVAAIRNQVAEWLNGGELKSEAVQQMLESAVSAYLDSLETSYEGGPAMGHHADISVLYQNDKYITLCFSEMLYLGGAHPGTSYSFATFRKPDGKKLELSDILSSTDDKGLVALIANGLEANLGMSLEDVLFEPADSLHLPETAPYLDSLGVGFFYQQYEIAPYACGTPAVVVPFAEMSPYMTAGMRKLVGF